MRPFRLGRWGLQVLPLGTRPPRIQYRAWMYYSSRFQSTAPTAAQEAEQPAKRRRGRPRKALLESNLAIATPPSTEPPLVDTAGASSPEYTSPTAAPVPFSSPDDQDAFELNPSPLSSLPSPPPDQAHHSPKLAALHARLSLPHQLPLKTLMRTLIHPTADFSPHFNNAALAALGNSLLGYYMSEHLLVHYPRLPMAVIFAAQQAYVGPASLASVAQGWGIEAAAESGSEVDPGLLQFKRAMPGSDPDNVRIRASTRPHKNRRGDVVDWRRGMSSRVVYDDSFGELQRRPGVTDPREATLERAATEFVRALAGAVYLHAGSDAAFGFFRNHVLSRHLDMASLFTFTSPLRDLSRLCAREEFEPPLARLESETGRLSKHAVFVVGIYSGRDRLGVAAGSSLNEARFKAAVAALKGWYLYSPTAGQTAQGEMAVLPSETEGSLGSVKEFRPALVDYGEVVA